MGFIVGEYVFNWECEQPIGFFVILWILSIGINVNKPFRLLCHQLSHLF